MLGPTAALTFGVTGKNEAYRAQAGLTSVMAELDVRAGDCGSSGGGGRARGGGAVGGARSSAAALAASAKQTEEEDLLDLLDSAS